MKIEQRRRLHWSLVLALALGSSEAEASDTSLNEVDQSQPFLRWQRPGYNNYAITYYENYLNHTRPYGVTPQARFDPLGNHLITGYDLYDWNEIRREGLRFGSSIWDSRPQRFLLQDDIPDEIVVFDNDTGSPVHLALDFLPDQLFYRDSMVSDTYLEGRLTPWSSVEFVQKLRGRFNWQNGGELRGSLFQRQRRIDFWTSASRIVGFNAEKIDYDSPFLDDRDVYTRTFFVRMLVGFTEFGRPI